MWHRGHKHCLTCIRLLVAALEIDSHVYAVVSALRAPISCHQHEDFVASRNRTRLVQIRQLTWAATSVARAGGEQVEYWRHSYAR